MDNIIDNPHFYVISSNMSISGGGTTLLNLVAGDEIQITLFLIGTGSSNGIDLLSENNIQYYDGTGSTSLIPNWISILSFGI